MGRRQLQHGALDPHRVVVADDPPPAEGADALELTGRQRRAPGLDLDRWWDAELRVETPAEPLEHGVGAVDVVGTGQAELGHEPVLAGSPQALDPALVMVVDANGNGSPNYLDDITFRNRDPAPTIHTRVGRARA